MRPKKLLGQNFLKDKTVLQKIIEAADLKPNDSVIEIGPGTGILTEELIKHAGKVIAIEKDDNLAEKIDSRFRGNDKVKIINEDILKINLPELIEQNNFENYKVVANIPYYITSPIIRLFLETRYPPRVMFLTLQKEVAERICGRPGQMSVLAVSVQYYAQPELLFYINKKAFWPIPEVDSAAVRIEARRKKPEEGSIETKKFFRVVKAGFSAKRKTLLNNLSGSLCLDRKMTEKKLKKIPLSGTQRAQELSVEDWKELARIF